MTELSVRPARADDDDALWSILEPVLRAGDSYALPRDWSREAALAYWRQPGHSVYVAEIDRRAAGTYYLKFNSLGPGDHVCNCGYMTAGWARWRGVAAFMGRHSLAEAAARGFRAMQFNCVVATNAGAVRLWESLGFDVVGRLPGAFRHPSAGDVDALVMFRKLDPGATTSRA